MAFGLYSLLEAALLCLNAICILHEERFLAKSTRCYILSAHILSGICVFISVWCKVGWGTDQRGFGEEPGMKTQVLNLIRSIRTVMRIPLIGINVLVIVFKLVLG